MKTKTTDLLVEHNNTNFKNLKIVETGNFISAAYCSKLFSDLGAQIIKIEKQDVGDLSRTIGPFPGDISHPEKSGLFLYLNSNKKGITLNPEKKTGKKMFYSLVEWCDILIENHQPSFMKKHGFDYKSLAKINPKLILTSITPFGQSGPYKNYKAYSINCSAAGGESRCIGKQNREPLTPPLSAGAYQAGAMAASASMIALFAREKNGWGQHVDVSEAEVWACLHTNLMTHSYVFEGKKKKRSGHRTFGFYPYTILPCKDGYISLIAVLGSQWKKFLEVVGNGKVPDWYANDPRFKDRWLNSIKHADEIDGLLAPWLMAHSKQEIFEKCMDKKIPLTPVRSIKEVINSDDLNQKNYFTVNNHPYAGKIKYPGIPYKFRYLSKNPGQPAPLLGQHNKEVFCNISKYLQNRIEIPSCDDIPKQKKMILPLEGYRVIDFGQTAAVPIMGALLADAGAEVIKIESRNHWDTSRFTPDNLNRNPDKDPWFHCFNRGKLGITLNLKEPEAVEIAKKLIRLSDIVIENFSPGVMTRFGLNYDELVKTKPDIIMMSMSGFGQDGMFSRLQAYGPSLNAFSGIDGMVGYKDDKILGMQQPFSDINSPIHGVFALLTALFQKQSTGKGDYIDMSQLEALISVMGEPIIDFMMNNRNSKTLGNTDSAMSPHNNYPCKGDDRWVSIAVRTEKEWENFCRAIKKPAWRIDEKFATSHLRIKNRKELDMLVSEWTKKYTDLKITEILQAAGVAAFHCMDIEDRYNDRHFAEREVFVWVNDSDGDKFVLANTPYKMSKTAITVNRPAPMLGEHNEYVLSKILGLKKKEIDILYDKKILY